MSKPSNVIFVGKKPLMTYVTATLVQLANEDLVTIKARGMSIGRAVDIAQIVEKRMGAIGYQIKDVRLGSESLQSQDGRMRNVSTIEIDIVKPESGSSPDSPTGESKENPASTNKKGTRRKKNNNSS